MIDYPPLTQSQLRELYDSNPTPELRRALFEIHRQHGVLRSVEGYRKTFELAGWTEQPYFKKAMCVFLIHYPIFSSARVFDIKSCKKSLSNF
ncbi:MAG: hypothetical protein JHC61_00850 [Burkholderiaceae bacterium]|nr:hypothetical protein [Burkholderiaceae bacterium]